MPDEDAVRLGEVRDRTLRAETRLKRLLQPAAADRRLGADPAALGRDLVEQRE